MRGLLSRYCRIEPLLVQQKTEETQYETARYQHPVSSD